MAFQQALSGLNASSKAIDVTSHNIANASTVGFKAGSAHFADMYAASLTGAAVSQAGIGVSIAAIQQQFSQGSLTSTNNPLDMSINGNGFFAMSGPNGTTYTRNGQFHLDKNGYIVNDQDSRLTGYALRPDGSLTSTPTEIKIDPEGLKAVATGKSEGGDFTGMRAALQLDSRATLPTLEWADAEDGLFSPNPNTYNYSTATSIFDSRGGEHTLTMFFRLSETTNTWDVHFSVDGTSNQFVAVDGPSALTFNTNGGLAGGSPLRLTVDLASVNEALGLANIQQQDSPIEFEIDFTGTTSFAGPFATNRLEQDGYAPGNLIGVSVGKDGEILGRYSNGRTKTQGQVVLTTFTNPNGLQPIGNNQWISTPAAGNATPNPPGVGMSGVLTPASVEESNVDLTAELVNLITNQRNYQANAQSIKTQDQLMQTLINLR